MTVKEYIQKGHKWTDMKGVPVGDDKHIQFIHNKFFEGEELKFQNELIRECKKLCPKVVGEVRVYGGDTPDANMVDWIYTQCAEIVRSIEAVRDYLERDGVTIDSRCTQFIRGWAPSKAYISKVARIFSLKYQYNDRDDFGEFTLSGFDFEQANKDRALLLARKDKIEDELHKYDGYTRLPRKAYFHSQREDVRQLCRLASISFALQLIDGKTVRELNYKELAMSTLPPAHTELERLDRDVNSLYVNTILQAVTEILQISLPVCKKSIARYIKW